MIGQNLFGFKFSFVVNKDSIIASTPYFFRKNNSQIFIRRVTIIHVDYIMLLFGPAPPSKVPF